MLRYAFPVTAAALVFAAGGAANAGMVLREPVQVAHPAPNAIDQQDLSSESYNYYYAFRSPALSVPIPPAAVWLPGQYNRNPVGGAYEWSKGEFALPEHADVGIIDGRWLETASRPDTRGWSSALMRLVKLIAPSV